MVRTQGLEEATHALPHGSVSEAVKLLRFRGQMSVYMPH